VPRIRPCLAVEQVVAGEVLTLALPAGMMVRLAVGQPLCSMTQAALRSTPTGGSADPAIPISSDRFLCLNIGESSGINLRAEPLCLKTAEAPLVRIAPNDGGVVNV